MGVPYYSMQQKQKWYKNHGLNALGQKKETVDITKINEKVNSQISSMSDKLTNDRISQMSGELEHKKILRARKARSQDYLDREHMIEKNNALDKVSLIGRTRNNGKTNVLSVMKSLKGSEAKNKIDNQMPSTDSFNSRISTSKIKDEMSIVTFDVTPDLSEQGNIIPINIGQIRSAASVVVYMGSPSRTFTINAKFVSRTLEEADKTFKYVNILKAWRMPVRATDEPETLRLFGYDGYLRGIPVILSSINIEYPSDVDYIDSVPIIQTVSLTLTEVRTLDDMFQFDYQSFKEGTLVGW